jgi:anti-sigma factor RsiW
MAHEQVQELYSAYVDEDLDTSVEDGFLEHLDGCPDCQGGLERFEKAVAEVRGTPRLRAPTSFSRQVMRRVKQRKRRTEALGWFAGPLHVPAEAIVPILMAAAAVALIYFLGN